MYYKDYFKKAFEEMRIEDLKVDINTVLAEVRKSYHKKCNGEGLPDCAGCRAHRLYQDLTWFKKDNGRTTTLVWEIL